MTPTDYDWLLAFRLRLKARKLMRGSPPGWRSFAIGVVAGAAVLVASLLWP